MNERMNETLKTAFCFVLVILVGIIYPALLIVLPSPYIAKSVFLVPIRLVRCLQDAIRKKAGNFIGKKIKK